MPKSLHRDDGGRERKRDGAAKGRRLIQAAGWRLKGNNKEANGHQQAGVDGFNRNTKEWQSLGMN